MQRFVLTVSGPPQTGLAGITKPVLSVLPIAPMLGARQRRPFARDHGRFTDSSAFAIALHQGVATMSKEQRSNKETRKVPVMTQKEKKAAKKAKKNQKGLLGSH
jgi:hypothetical protein